MLAVRKIFDDLWTYRAMLVIVLAPIVFSPLVTSSSKETKCAYVIILMGIYWITESLPIAVTALLPLILFPVLGVVQAKTIARVYLQDSLILFTCGYFITISVEQANLHRRIALRALMVVGHNPKWILFGIMSTTSFLSMWISNAAAAAMMLPIVEIVLIEIIRDYRLYERVSTEDAKGELKTDNAKLRSSIDVVLNAEQLSKKELNLCKMMLLSICYSALIGGVGTITGTPPNVIVTGMLEIKYGPNTGVTFASWMALAIPIVVLNFVFAWFLLQLFFLGWRETFSFKRKPMGSVGEIIKVNYEALGRMKYSFALHVNLSYGQGNKCPFASGTVFRETSVAILFTILVLLWVFRSPGFVSGWSSLFPKGYVSDGTAAAFMLLIFTIFPSEWPDFLCFPNRKINQAPIIREPLLTWKTIQTKFPWGIMLLVGGSFGMAAGIESSGLTKTISNYLTQFSYWPPAGLCAISSLIAAFITEFTSNAATATILVPVLTAVAESLHLNPLYLVLPSTISVSYAFMLPVSSNPNAVVFAFGLLKVVDMVKVGFFMNCITVSVTLLAMNTWGWLLFDLGSYPSWAPHVLANVSLDSIANITSY